ncbi:MAG: D-alanyl-D-alanine carboxypeptidase [Sphingobacteriales bacterium]|nr:D-alanyl-D-alanine carboxypeptidase [Sphingobacteriales bacterium]
MTLEFLLLSACSINKQISRSAKENVIRATPLRTAHIGISIYDPAAGKYLYNYQGDKYFVPASNTKIPTCYAAMKYLGDSLVGLRYGVPEEKGYKDQVIGIKPAGDPTFLEHSFASQPVFEFLYNKVRNQGLKLALFYDSTRSSDGLGNGWSWNDYEETYMAEHNRFPVFGNVITASLVPPDERVKIDSAHNSIPVYSLFKTGSSYFDKLLNQKQTWINRFHKYPSPAVRIGRSFSTNDFYIREAKTVFTTQQIPFVTNGMTTVSEFLGDTLKRKTEMIEHSGKQNLYAYYCENCDIAFFTVKRWVPVYSRPTDSLLKPMMHRSDNFFAEQSLLMVSNEMLGYMNDEKIIDTILKTDFKDLPQKPRWADGSGLSRYNLFTPQDFVAILNKMKQEFGMERIKTIFATGGEGTISSYFKADSGYIYAKTGTLSGVVALSGFLYTKKGKLLIFSTLVNNHQASATEVRRAVEKFIQGIREKN